MLVGLKWLEVTMIVSRLPLYIVSISIAGMLSLRAKIFPQTTNITDLK